MQFHLAADMETRHKRHLIVLQLVLHCKRILDTSLLLVHLGHITNSCPLASRSESEGQGMAKGEETWPWKLSLTNCWVTLQIGPAPCVSQSSGTGALYEIRAPRSLRSPASNSLRVRRLKACLRATSLLARHVASSGPIWGEADNAGRMISVCEGLASELRELR